jgi:hypothetical protein
MQKLNVKMDLVVAGISDLKERMVKLEDLPAQLREGFTAIGSQISSFRKMVLQVSPGPEVYTAYGTATPGRSS